MTDEKTSVYMDKNSRYQELFEKVRLYLEGETDPIARMAEIAAIVHEGMGFFWTGFYRVIDNQLVLGPFQGTPACLRIAYCRGVCGTAWKERRTIVVPDVEQFPGHIACSSASRSEIVVPVFAKAPADSDLGTADGTKRCDSQDDTGRTVIAVFDIDSDRLATFDADDARWLELIVSIL